MRGAHRAYPPSFPAAARQLCDAILVTDPRRGSPLPTSDRQRGSVQITPASPSAAALERVPLTAPLQPVAARSGDGVCARGCHRVVARTGVR